MVREVNILEWKIITLVIYGCYQFMIDDIDIQIQVGGLFIIFRVLMFEIKFIRIYIIHVFFHQSIIVECEEIINVSCGMIEFMCQLWIFLFHLHHPFIFITE